MHRIQSGPTYFTNSTLHPAWKSDSDSDDGEDEVSDDLMKKQVSPRLDRVIDLECQLPE